jgi:hypothetical protein
MSRRRIQSSNHKSAHHAHHGVLPLRGVRGGAG